LSRPTKDQIKLVADKAWQDGYKPILARYRIDGELVEAWITKDYTLTGERKADGIK